MPNPPDPALTDGVTASLPQQHAADPAPAEKPDVEYVIVKNAHPTKYNGETYGASCELVPGPVFKTDDAAYMHMRGIHASDNPMVVRVPPGFKVASIEEELRATKYLRQIKTLITGKDQRFQTEAEMAEVVETCSRVFHAYRTRRDETLREAVIAAAKNASSLQLLLMAERLNVLPVEYGDDPFQSEETSARHKAIDPLSRRRA